MNRIELKKNLREKKLVLSSSNTNDITNIPSSSNLFSICITYIVLRKDNYVFNNTEHYHYYGKY